MSCTVKFTLLILSVSLGWLGCGAVEGDDPKVRADVLIAEARPPPDVPDARFMRIGMFLKAPGETVDVTLFWNLTPPSERHTSNIPPSDFSEVPKEAIIENSLAFTGIELLADGKLRVPLPKDTVGFLVDVDPSTLPSFCHRLDFLLQIEGRSEFFEVKTDGWTLPLLDIQPSVEILTSAEIQEDANGSYRIVAVDEWPIIVFSPAEGFFPRDMRRGCSTEPVQNGTLETHVSREVEPLDLSLLAGPGGVSSGVPITGLCAAYYTETRPCEEFWNLTRAERESATRRAVYVDFLAP